MRCELLSVGTEILLGDIVNTNAQFLAKELASMGIDIYYQSVVGDNKERMLQAFKEGLSRSDMIITTGGLGPTKDDMTKELACEYFGYKCELHEESLESIKEYFRRMGREFVESNEKQAYFPKEAIILKNNAGTAPGAIIKKDDKTIIVLPGPPSEMKRIFNESVRPYLEKLTGYTIVSEVVRIHGVGESKVEELVQDLIDNGKNPTVAPYAKEGEVTLRVTAKAKTKEEGEKLIDPVLTEIKNRLGDSIYNIGEDGLNLTVAKLLVDKKLTIGTSESCTGGLLGAGLIDYPGISISFLEGAITYSNEAKIKTLGVKEETLEKFGAVSEETAREMAEGIRKRCGADIGVSTTGIAGPDGGTDDKPVGLVYIGLSIGDKTIVTRNVFNGDRNSVRRRACLKAFDMIRLEINK
ncbi:competence/damage-inducible protein A [Clostridium thermobutyricum]|uniref:Putative competence-damage inducible protein n=1 Tax=Clostridium thermobutyricum DSM 4928 TaxID=1121339 RepID=A0A1V4SXZ7_9CLOT|nr:competence/damage-inducible protein A [Clostridium thermobutyricum]OPX48395.1 putative competence-damage inducible protein [Clostridium thermobutyricum DSM 4928]